MATITSLDANIFPLCLGGNTFGWTSNDGESRAVMDAYVEGGGNFIDTADNYSWWVDGNSGGESEVIIGQWMRDRGARDSTVIATKAGRHPDFAGLSATVLPQAVEASLKRLQVDYIDLYYAHHDDPKTPLDETVAAFDALRVAGKIRAVAVSNYSAVRVQQWLDISDANGFARPVALQPHYNLVHRAQFESLLAPMAERYDIAVIPYFGLASGFLTGKYRTHADIEASPRASMLDVYFNGESLAVVQALCEVAEAHSVAPATIALAWLRVQPSIVAPVASARRVDQVAGLLASATLELSTEELDRLTALSSEIASSV